MLRSKLLQFILMGLLVLGSAGAPSLVTCASADRFLPDKNLLLIGWDGVQWDDLQDMLKGGLLPNLASLRASGALVHLSITDHETCTKPGWTQICTGLSAKASGVYSNTRFQPFPRNASLYEKLEELSEHRIFTAFMAGKAHHLGSLGPGIKWFDDEIGKGSSDEGEPWMNAKGSFDDWYGDKNRAAHEVGLVLHKVLQNYGQENRFAIFAHFADPDKAGHDFGEGSQEYRRAIVVCDSWLGKIQTHLRDNGLEHDTWVAVVTDHGFDKGEKHHFNAPDSFLAVNDPSHKYHDGNMVDVAPTLLHLLDAPRTTYVDLPGHALWE